MRHERGGVALTRAGDSACAGHGVTLQSDRGAVSVVDAAWGGGGGYDAWRRAPTARAVKRSRDPTEAIQASPRRVARHGMEETTES